MITVMQLVQEFAMQCKPTDVIFRTQHSSLLVEKAYSIHAFSGIHQFKIRLHTNTIRWLDIIKFTQTIHVCAHKHLDHHHHFIRIDQFIITKCIKLAFANVRARPVWRVGCLRGNYKKKNRHSTSL